MQIFPKPSQKIESINKAFLFWYWLQPKKNLFRNKTFLFFKIGSWNFQHLFKNEFHETSQNFNSIWQPREKMYVNCLNELTLREVSQNSFSNRCWKFQLSILKSKKVLFLKKMFLALVSKHAKIIPKDGASLPNLQWRVLIFPYSLSR